MLDLGIFYVPIAMVFLVGWSNAVNLSDGLDGLAIVPAMIAVWNTGPFGMRNSPSSSQAPWLK